jgi:hypothetical protein
VQRDDSRAKAAAAAEAARAQAEREQRALDVVGAANDDRDELGPLDDEPGA